MALSSSPKTGLEPALMIRPRDRAFGLQLVRQAVRAIDPLEEQLGVTNASEPHGQLAGSAIYRQ